MGTGRLCNMCAHSARTVVDCGPATTAEPAEDKHARLNECINESISAASDIDNAALAARLIDEQHRLTAARLGHEHPEPRTDGRHALSTRLIELLGEAIGDACLRGDIDMARRMAAAQLDLARARMESIEAGL